MFSKQIILLLVILLNVNINMVLSSPIRQSKGTETEDAMNTIDLKQILLRREDSWATPYSRELPVKSTYILLYFLRNRRENRSIDQKTIKDSQTDPQVNIGKTSRGPPAKIGDMLIDSKVSQLKHTKVPKRKHHIKKRDLKKWNTLHESLT